MMWWDYPECENRRVTREREGAKPLSAGFARQPIRSRQARQEAKTAKRNKARLLAETQPPLLLSGLGFCGGLGARPMAKNPVGEQEIRAIH